jgi:hypothetical protein
MGKIRSYKGVEVDTDVLFGNDKTPAIGNMNVNAGGDIIDANGNVVKSRDQVAREYHKDNKKTVVTSSLLDDIDDEEYTIPVDKLKKPAKKEKAEPEQDEE